MAPALQRRISDLLLLMTGISTRQNEREQIRRLGAQRNLYALSKLAFGWQVLLGGPVAVATAVGAILYPAFKGYFAAWALFVVLLDLFWLTPLQKRLRSDAARIQEEFDCAVLGLEWNEVKCGKRPDPESVREHSDKYEKWAHRMTPLANWYPPSVDELPLHVGRIACQRANCWWDSAQRRLYVAWVVGIIVTCSVLVFAAAYATGGTIDDLVLRAMVPMAPAWLLAMRQSIEQREAAERLDKLKDHCVSAWNSALAGRTPAELATTSRVLQDEIFESRRKAPPVLDFVFKRLRNDYDVRMNHAAEHLVAEANRALRSK